MNRFLSILAVLITLAAGCLDRPDNPPDGPDGSVPDTTVSSAVGTESLVPEKLDDLKTRTLHHISQNDIRMSSVKDKYAWMLFISSLQGLLNAKGLDPVYLQCNNEYDWSVEMAKSVGGVIDWKGDCAGMTGRLLPDVASDGYVLVDDFIQEDGSWTTDRNYVLTAVAASYAAAFQCLVLTESLANNSLFSGLACRFDARGKTMDDLLEFFRANPDKFAHDGIISTPRIPHRNVDLAIAHRWVAVHSFDDTQTGKFFSEIDPLSPRFSYNGPYSSEGLNVQFSSGYDLYALAAGWCGNLSTHERMVSRGVCRAHNMSRPQVDTSLRGVHYVLILCSDGGNLEYFDKKFRDCFTHSSYGTFPVSFMMTPAIRRYKPAVQDWYYDHIAPTCSFVTSLSGLGDIYPIYMSGDSVRAEYGRLTSEAMREEGQRYLAIMDRAGESKYGWDELVDASRPIIRNISGCEGVIFIGYGKIWGGCSAIVDGVPVVPIRYSCFYSNGKAMDDPDNPKSQKAVSDSLKAMPKNPESTEGYSIILFNANPPDIVPKPQIMSDMQVLVDYISEDPGLVLVDARQFFELYNYHIVKK